MNTKRKLSVFVLSVILITLCLFLAALKKGTQTKILSKSGEYWILNKGSNNGVQIGMRGNFWTEQQSGNKKYNVDIARFRVVKLEPNRCFVIVEEIGAGFSDKYFQWASFIQKLALPKKIIPKKQTKKNDTNSSSGIPSGKSMEWYMERGEKYFEAKKFKLAEVCYLRVLEKDPEDPGVKIELKKTREKLEAIEKQRTFRLRKNKRDRYFTQGDLFFKRGKFDTAIAYFIKAYKIFTEDNFLSAEKIITILKMNRDLYITTIKKEKINTKDICNTALTLAEKYIKVGEIEKAVRLFNILNQLGFDEINKKIVGFEKKIIKKKIDNYIKKGDEAFDKNNMQIGEHYFSKARELSLNEPVKSYRLEEVKKKILKIKGIEEKNLREERGKIIKSKLSNFNASIQKRDITEPRIESVSKVKKQIQKSEEKSLAQKSKIIEKESPFLKKKKLSVIAQENLQLDANINLAKEIDKRLNILEMGNTSINTSLKYMKEILQLMDASENLESMIKIFNQYNNQKAYLKSIKFSFFGRLLEKFKVSDLEKYIKYFKMYSKYGWVSPEKIEEYIKLKITFSKGILTFTDARHYLKDKILRAQENEKKIGEIELENGMKFIFIPAGKYKLQNRYRFVSSFLISKYEIKNKQYEKFCLQMGIKFKLKKKKYNHPVVKVSWNETKKYCHFLSKQIKLSIDLPTEAQWEKAALSGSSSIYFWGNKINRDYLWFWGNAKKLHEIGQKKPNHWGIYDILGNAAEWTNDWYSPLKKLVNFKIDPRGPKNGSEKVIKGGSWYSSHKEVMIPNRNSKKPKSKDPTIGFRVVINLDNIKKVETNLKKE